MDKTLIFDVFMNEAKSEFDPKCRIQSRIWGQIWSLNLNSIKFDVWIDQNSLPRDNDDSKYKTNNLIDLQLIMYCLFKSS